MFKVSSKDTRTTTPIVKFKFYSHLVLVFLLLTLNRLMLAEIRDLQHIFDG